MSKNLPKIPQILPGRFEDEYILIDKRMAGITRPEEIYRFHLQTRTEGHVWERHIYSELWGESPYNYLQMAVEYMDNSAMYVNVFPPYDLEYHREQNHSGLWHAIYDERMAFRQKGWHLPMYAICGRPRNTIHGSSYHPGWRRDPEQDMCPICAARMDSPQFDLFTVDRIEPIKHTTTKLQKAESDTATQMLLFDS